VEKKDDISEKQIIQEKPIEETQLYQGMKELADNTIKELGNKSAYELNEEAVRLLTKGKDSEINAKKALIFLYQAIKIDPNYILSYNNLGNIYAYGENYEEAIKIFDQALKISPNDVDTLLNKAKILGKMKNVEESLRTIALAYKADPKKVAEYIKKHDIPISMDVIKDLSDRYDKQKIGKQDENIFLQDIEKLTNKKFSKVNQIAYATSMEYTLKNDRIIELGLASCGLSTLPTSIENLAFLECLYLNNNQLATLPASIGNLKALKKLDLDNNQLKDLPESIGQLNSLESLKIEHNQLSDLPFSMRKLSSLEYLYIRNNRFISVPKCIWQISSLVSLEILEGNQLNPEIQDKFKATMKARREFFTNLYDNPQFTKEELKMLKEKIKSLKEWFKIVNANLVKEKEIGLKFLKSINKNIIRYQIDFYGGRNSWFLGMAVEKGFWDQLKKLGLRSEGGKTIKETNNSKVCEDRVIFPHQIKVEQLPKL